MNIERNKSIIESVPDKSILSDEISLNPSIASEIEKENYMPLECGLQKQTKRRPIEEEIALHLKIFKMVSPIDSPASSSTLRDSETEREYRRLHTRKPLLNILKL
ncbi:hypothetical protein JTB14_020801 [Gonioctena quinquepunctata]|nr:hypothetical protein JTB14_020801 [Gonioctena quinquepunctata]